MCDSIENEIEINSSCDENGSEVKIEKRDDVMEVIEQINLDEEVQEVKVEVKRSEKPESIIPVKIGQKIVKLVRLNGVDGRKMPVQGKQVFIPNVNLFVMINYWVRSL